MAKAKATKRRAGVSHIGGLYEDREAVAQKNITCTREDLLLFRNACTKDARIVKDGPHRGHAESMNAWLLRILREKCKRVMR